MITVQLPRDLENEIQAAVQRGQFSSVDEAIAEAARLLLRGLGQEHKPAPTPRANPSPPDPILGLMRQDPGLMDEIVADTYRQRQDATWREPDR
ncbi:ribbon-helix-helix domain-containing protein [Tautonia plasticadhaerens]|uniref:Uncharacterized protein n=1 Tax=Tautonia plasticadhaerens TaxID=2527974 RepID=A0A518HBQ5_9BACT|nr:ribbon-helix-helix domain-containing protein [Tautonia plasticadhaerens]QDV38293.1 hypothetical protein ElP_62440 [Tautonia plasticadhaerens]